MNLLLEQRPLGIPAKLQQSSSPITENDMNTSSSALILKLKRHSNQLQQENQLQSMTNDDNQHSRSNNSRLKRSIGNGTATATATRRPSSPAFNGKQQQTTKRSVTIDNNNNDLTGSTEENSLTKRFKSDELNSSTKVDACVETVSIGLATEPEHLGPCEPGTSVVLEGIVWNETDSGVLVVNVTWRGKTYVGTLLDSTKQDWACPRLICESPTSDYDPRHTNKTSRTKRANTSRYGNPSSAIASFASSNLSSFPISTNDDRKLRHNIKSRQSKRTNPTIAEEVSNNQSSPLHSPGPTMNQNTSTISSGPAKLIPCTEANCHKQFASSIALTFHLSDAHRNTPEPAAPPPPPTASIPTVITAPPPPPSTRDEEDVAHILVNVAEYVRRSSPPPPQPAPTTTLSWPCPQISSKLVLSSPLNNNEQTSIIPSNSSTTPRFERDSSKESILDILFSRYNEANLIDQSIKTHGEHEEIKPLVSMVKPADHFLLHIQDEPSSTLPTTSPPLVNNYSNVSSWINVKKERISSKKSNKIPTPPPVQIPPPHSTFIPIPTNNSTLTVPPTSSSPAYSDISDEDPTSRNDSESIAPSTVNLLAANNEKVEEHEQSYLPNTRWTPQMLLQQYGSYMQQPFITNNSKDTSSNRLNSNKTTPSLNSNGTSDSTVKNILDARRLSTSKASSPPSLTNDSNDLGKTLFHYHSNGIVTDPLINTLTSPNENLLKASMSNPLDYSLNPSNCSSTTLHSSR